MALGKLGWPLRRIEEETGVRRETASGYLKAAGVPVRPPRGWGRLLLPLKLDDGFAARLVDVHRQDERVRARA